MTFPRLPIAEAHPADNGLGRGPSPQGATCLGQTPIRGAAARRAFLSRRTERVSRLEQVEELRRLGVEGLAAPGRGSGQWSDPAQIVKEPLTQGRVETADPYEQPGTPACGEYRRRRVGGIGNNGTTHDALRSEGDLVQLFNEPIASVTQ